MFITWLKEPISAVRRGIILHSRTNRAIGRAPFGRGHVLSVAALIFAPPTDVEMAYPSQVLVVGQSVLEFQVRSAHRAGAQHILVFAERITSHILAAIDRLARDAIKVELVRTAAEAGDHLHPEELTMVAAANVVAEPAVFNHLVERVAVCVLAVRDVAGSEALERIDGFTRWSGLALLSGSLIRQTAHTVGEWDFAGTLLRQALQAGVALEIQDRSENEALLIAIVQDQETATMVNKALLRGEQVPSAGLIDQYLWAPLSSLVMPWLLRGAIEPNFWVALVGLLSIMTLACAWFAPMIVPLLIFVVAGLVTRIAQRLVRISLRSARHINIIIMGRAIAGGMSFVIIARHLVDYGIGWGYYILAVWLLLELFRLSILDPWFIGKQGLPVWRAAPDAIAIGLIIGHLVDFDVLALELMVAYAVVSSGVLHIPRRS